MLVVFQRLLIAALCCYSQVSMGTTMASFSIDDLIRGSDAIIVGKVGESELRQPDADNMGVRQISTLVRVSVDTVVATRELSIGEMIRIQLAGGRKGKYVTAVMGTPNLNQGDRYVFFLKHGIGDYYGIVGMSQGVRLILSEGSGRKIRTCLPCVKRNLFGLVLKGGSKPGPDIEPLFAYLRRIESRIVRELGHSRRSHSDRLRRPKLTLAIHDGAEAYAAGYYQCTRSIHNLKFEWENDQSISMVYRTDQKK